MIFWILGSLAYAAIGFGVAMHAADYGKKDDPGRTGGLILVGIVWPLWVLAILGARLVAMIP